MANVDLGSGRATIYFQPSINPDVVKRFIELFEGLSLFNEYTDFEIRSGVENGRSFILLSAQGGWSPTEVIGLFSDLASKSFNLSPHDKEHLMQTEIYCSSYDWESNYRDIAVKQSGSKEFSVYIHEGVTLGWHELLHKAGCFQLAQGEAFENSDVGASICLLEVSSELPKAYLFEVTAQASYGLLLCTQAEIICFLEEPDDDVNSLHGITEFIDDPDETPDNIDEWTYSNEIKDDLLSNKDMYIHDRGPILPRQLIEKAISVI